MSEISEPCYLFTRQPETLQWFKELQVTGPQISWDMMPRLCLYDLTAKVAVERESWSKGRLLYTTWNYMFYAHVIVVALGVILNICL